MFLSSSCSLSLSLSLSISICLFIPTHLSIVCGVRATLAVYRLLFSWGDAFILPPLYYFIINFISPTCPQNEHLSKNEEHWGVRAAFFFQAASLAIIFLLSSSAAGCLGARPAVLARDPNAADWHCNTGTHGAQHGLLQLPLARMCGSVGADEIGAACAGRVGGVGRLAWRAWLHGLGEIEHSMTQNKPFAKASLLTTHVRLSPECSSMLPEAAVLAWPGDPWQRAPPWRARVSLCSCCVHWHRWHKPPCSSLHQPCRSARARAPCRSR